MDIFVKVSDPAVHIEIIYFSNSIKPTEAKVAILGLDGAGKTSILYRLIFALPDP